MNCMVTIIISFLLCIYFYKMVPGDVISCVIDITGLRSSPAYDRLKLK